MPGAQASWPALSPNCNSSGIGSGYKALLKEARP